ncbi:hypothetical protein CB0940_07737 [Cercospora beticola]|uniref:PLD phosphodiesterase domain-containing protein n=1 Tax=Cercospora beticola TaxID=122368 RepID=A0A2G5H816_CERBT|nr:hypothetical protein CB0940_07737 [Cercospora beticola]PIA88675.1 hypothetical protein CB0940_07737 [Cercospora beticola]WPB03706.1 hypothetical protein RHO25_008350 [Cercospora beticola]CAK1357534.1 unnamed protein product [Cercospora beticola]
MSETANIRSLTFGTGYQIFKSSILPAIESAEEEVILTTCFWAASPTRDALNDTLLKLSAKALARSPPNSSVRRIKVRIGFSSSSLLQKLFHTSSPSGRIYSPSEWSKKLGLPAAEDLEGLDLEVTSIFFLPFSVWHPKFVVVDRKEVFLPSCNVSWEEWFEGCVRLDGSELVRDFLKFWELKWRGRLEGLESSLQTGESGHDSRPTTNSLGLENVKYKFLPSPHHRNPRFRFFPWQKCADPPRTPLNVELLELFAGAKKSIYVQSPNVTCPPVLKHLLDAVRRGVDVTIVTSEKLMILEQLVTAGTTTSRCMGKLVKSHQTMVQAPRDVEAGAAAAGSLRISYYVPRSRTTATVGEPVQSHLKLTIVDNEAIVFGSGNMDRASWYTSQELGVAFYSNELVAETKQKLQHQLEGRTKLYYEATKGS